MQERIRGNEYRTTMLCVDSYDSSVLKGRMFNPYLEEGSEFTSAIDLLLQMEGMLDEMGCPLPFNAIRTFSPVSQADTNTASHPTQSGKKATFAVKILFRQNASWQGTVTWIEGHAEQSFRSFMELLLLMDSALSAN